MQSETATCLDTLTDHITRHTVHRPRAGRTRTRSPPTVCTDRARALAHGRSLPAHSSFGQHSVRSASACSAASGSATMITTAGVLHVEGVCRAGPRRRKRPGRPTRVAPCPPTMIHSKGRRHRADVSRLVHASPVDHHDRAADRPEQRHSPTSALW